MRPVISASQSKCCDGMLINDFGIAGITLMHRAADGLYAAVSGRIAPDARVLVLCGPGNNGGDGFLLAARLRREGYRVDVSCCFSGRLPQGDAALAHEEMLAAGCHVLEKEPEPDLYDCIVDALFGTGLRRALDGKTADLIERVNALDCLRVAVDIPSGVDGETGKVYGTCFHADVTVTFHYLKTGLVLMPGRMYCGKVIVSPISEIYPVNADAFLLEEEDVRKLLPPRQADSHKGKNGHALLIAGSGKYTGASLLAARAAMRGGCGITSVCVPAKVKPAFCTVPEVIALACGDGDGWDADAIRDALAALPKKRAVGVGPGMDKIGDGSLLESVLKACVPTVLDADALNDLAVRPELMQLLHEKVVLTPHPGEMARLTGMQVQDVVEHAPETAKSFAKKYGCTVLLKGATTSISDGRQVRFNITGGPGLSKGGSGDVLTGLTLAMLSQGLAPFDAACAASYLLGTGADAALRLLGNRMVSALDITDVLTQEINAVRGH